ncbi:hypothetical protein M9435_005609 [Picochlorum sp. BPE23]|nr:hypothetical protein M9435_005609 [Picochlorum sp. BPE23]
MRNIDDEHVSSSSLEQNIPVLIGLYTVWNTIFLGYSNCDVFLLYAQALSQLPVQQLSMESSGKGVAMDGSPLPYQVGEIDFGEAGIVCL